MAFGATRKAFSKDDVATTSHVVPLPTGFANEVLAGDFICLFFAIKTTDDIVATPAGWTRQSRLSDVTYGTNLYVFTRRSDGAEGASVTITTSAAVGSQRVVVAVEAAMLDEQVAATHGTGTAMASGSFQTVNPFTDYVSIAFGYRDHTIDPPQINGWPTFYSVVQYDVRNNTDDYAIQVAATSVRQDKPSATFTQTSSSGWGVAAFSLVEDMSPPPAPSLNPDLGLVLGSATPEQPIASPATRLSCCPGEDTNIGCVFGSATWWADAENAADGLGRYYPLGEVISQPAGVDIANGITAFSRGQFAASPTVGKMCEFPEVFQGYRSYSLPLASAWDASKAWTVSMLFTLDDTEGDQSLFTVEPSLRLGISWAREVMLTATGADGVFYEAWSTETVSEGVVSHLALTYNWGYLTAYLNGMPVVTLKPDNLKPFTFASIGSWQGAAFASGKMQDVRIYDHAKYSDFLTAESGSYCADWVTVRGA